MQPELRTTPLEYAIYGFSVQHDAKRSYGEEIIALLNRVWPALKSGKIASDGINRVVYDREPGQVGECTVFAGVRLDESDTAATNAARAAGMQRKVVRLNRYAYWKHIGPYRLIPKTCEAMTTALEAQHGLRLGRPMVEVYGHWSQDESKLETETFVEVV